jgi:hypothetical protein
MARIRTHLAVAAALSAAITFPAAALADPPGMPTLPPAPAAPAEPPAQVEATPSPAPAPAPAATAAPQPATPVAPPSSPAPTTHPAPPLRVSLAPLSGRRLKVRVTCGADGDITVKSGSRTLAHSSFTCKHGAATRTLKLRGTASKATVLTRSAGRTVKLNLRPRTAHASALTTVGNTCLGSGAGAAYGGSQVLGVDFNTSFGVASRGETIWWRGYLYTYNPYTRSGGYVDGGAWHNYMLTDYSGGTLNGNVLTIGGGYVGSDQQAFTVSHGTWTYGLIVTWTQSTGYRWHWIPATDVFAPALASANGYCWF